MRAGRLVAALLGAALLGTGCASIPRSSSPQVFSLNTQESTGPNSDDLRYDVIQPRQGETRREIIEDFIALGGSHRDQHAGARAYLTPAAARKWDDGAGVSVLEENRFYDDKGASGLLMTATQRGRIEKDGTYLPNVVAYPYLFEMEQVGGEWRISNPPDGVFVTEGTFERSWRPYNVYFLDPTRTRLVPDVRMVPYPQDSTLASRLVGYLGDGPSLPLKDSVASDLDGVRLQSNIVRDGTGGVAVYLVRAGADDDTFDPGGFAQLVWTLNQVGVGSLELFLNGRPISPRGQPRRTQQRVSDWRGFDPDALPVTTPGYFVRDGAVLTTTGEPVPGPAGNRSFGARSVGVSLPQQGRQNIAVVRRAPGGVELLVGRLGGTLRSVLTARSLTPPSWGAAFDEVWTVKDGSEIVSVQNGQASSVLAPDLEGLEPVSSLRLSRDGVRVAVVVGPPKQQLLELGVVVRANGAARSIRLDPVDIGASPVTEVSWSDAHTLTVLVGSGAAESNLYTYVIDGKRPGQIVNAAELPGPPVAVAAAPNLPLLAIANHTVVFSPGAGKAWKRLTPPNSGVESAPAYPG